jgi:hypothetical protein
VLNPQFPAYAIGRVSYFVIMLLFDDMKLEESIIIYTVGKVGSCTMLNSLKAVAGNRMIYQIHTLDKEAISERYYENLNRPAPGHIMRSRIVRDQLGKGLDSKRVKIISLTREPISRNISAFFENIETFVPGFYERGDNTEPGKLNDLIQLFLNEHAHVDPSAWFDAEIKTSFGIDIFLSEFPKMKGYKIYRGDCADLFVLRLENIEQCCCNDDFLDFCEIWRFNLINVNLADRKSYYEVYQKFIDAIEFPFSYVDKMYSSRYAQHFYSDEEINMFIKKWKITSEI